MKETPQHNWYAVIPAEILLDKTLSSTQKLLIALISNLSNHKGFCYATNKYLGECLNLSSKTISDNISELEKRGIIIRNLIRKEGTAQVEKRMIKIKTLSRKISTPLPKNLYPPLPKNTEGNNKVLITKIIM